MINRHPAAGCDPAGPQDWPLPPCLGSRSRCGGALRPGVRPAAGNWHPPRASAGEVLRWRWRRWTLCRPVRSRRSGWGPQGGGRGTVAQASTGRSLERCGRTQGTRLPVASRPARLGKAPQGGRPIGGHVKAPSGWQDPSRWRPQGFSASAPLTCGAGSVLGGGVRPVRRHESAAFLVSTHQRPTAPYQPL